MTYSLSPNMGSSEEAWIAVLNAPSVAYPYINVLPTQYRANIGQIQGKHNTQYPLKYWTLSDKSSSYSVLHLEGDGTFRDATMRLALKVLDFWNSFRNRIGGSLTVTVSLKPLWSGMGEVVPARTLPTLHPPCPPTVLSWSCLKFHSTSIGVTSTVREGDGDTCWASERDNLIFVERLWSWEGIWASTASRLRLMQYDMIDDLQG